MRPIDRIIIHTNGSPGRTVWQIRAYHLLKGWKDIGYHWVIYEDGSLHQGRPESRPGAHVQGLNLHTIGVCFIGNGDKDPLTAEQMTTGLGHVCDMADRLKVATRDILGHRETTHLVHPALATKKTCPGLKVDMNNLRRIIGGFRGETWS